MFVQFRFGSLAVGLFACFALVGCDGGKGEISGTVTVDGVPLKGGNVSFVPTDSGPSFSAPIQENGTYKVSNVPARSYKVCVETESLKPKMGGGPPPGANAGSFSKAPPKGMGGQTDVLADVKSGKIKHGPPPGKEGAPPEGQERPKDGLTQMVENAKKYVPIRASYAKPETTDLSFTAKSGAQTFDIDVKGP